jgi:hypothetical protein
MGFRRQCFGGLAGVCVMATAWLAGCDDTPVAPLPPAGAGAGGEAVSAAGGHGGRGPGEGNETGGAPSACKTTPDLSPHVPAVTELDPDLVARAAVVIGSCMPDDGVARNAMHIWLAHVSAARTYFRSAAQLECLANADCGCAAIEHCLGWVYESAAGECAGTCDGDVWSGCGDGIKLSMDCSRFGLTCDPDASCLEGEAEPCEGEGEDPGTCTADGNVRFCDDGFMREAPCESLGFRCDAGRCTGTGAACTQDLGHDSEVSAPVGTGCDGDVLIGCLNGKITSQDCSEEGPGFTCQALEDSFFCGLSAECLPSYDSSIAAPSSCSGTVLSFCTAGKLEQLDCTELGFSGCNIDSKLAQYGCTPGATLE